MNRLRLFFVIAGALVLGAFLVQPVMATIKTQQDQIGITIVVNVTPSPIAYTPRRNSVVGDNRIAAAMSVHPAPESMQHAFHAESLQFMGFSPKVIAQAQVQRPVLVQAEVTPNPKATLLYSNSGSVVINAVAGSTVVIPCAFTVTADSTASWTLEQGLSNDFASGFPGTDLANNTYVSSATPQPTATPYVVYADDGNAWSLTGGAITKVTYCVGLTLKVPGTVLAGTYSTNAIYTLYFGA